MALPTNVDSTYADDPNDASVQAHQSHHDAVHTFYNKFDHATAPVAGNTWVWNDTEGVYKPAASGGSSSPVTPVFVMATMSEAGQSGFSEIGVSTNYYFNSYRLNNGTVDTWVEFDVGLVAGTYTFDLWNYKNTDRGIYTVALDGTSIGTIDGYAAAGAASRDSITGISVAAAGVKRVRLTMATKNASSSGYWAAISALSFSKTA